MKRLLPIAIAAVFVVAALTVGLTAVLASGSESNGRGGTLATGNSEVGTVLVDRRGRTLYLFEKDGRGESACSGACATEWPPLVARRRATAAGSARASLVGTTERSDGRRQVTYHGHPLYRYVGDSQPGQTTGQGSRAFGARWFVVSPAGDKVELSGSSQSSQSPYGGE